MNSSDPVSNYIVYFFVLGLICIILHLFGLWREQIRRRHFRKYVRNEYRGRIYTWKEISRMVDELMQERTPE